MGTLKARFYRSSTATHMQQRFDEFTMGQRWANFPTDITLQT